MSNEIKQGDKVRVSKDAPWLYVGGLDRIFAISDSVVTAIEDDNAAIKCYHGQAARILIIPTKYLVKVDAETKEAKFKVGDKVRMKDGYYKEELHGCIGTIRKIDKCHIYVEIDSTIYPATIHSIEHYTEPTAPTIKVGDRVRSKGYGLEAVVLGIDGEFIAVRRDDGIKQEWNISITELVEPTEQTEAHTDANKRLQEEYMRLMKDCMSGEIYTQSDFIEDYDPSKHEVSPKPRYTPEIKSNTEFWVKYEADLAKELAIAYGKRGKSPLDAVAAAKEITKRLKQK